MSSSWLTAFFSSLHFIRSSLLSNPRRICMRRLPLRPGLCANVVFMTWTLTVLPAALSATQLCSSTVGMGGPGFAVAAAANQSAGNPSPSPVPVEIPPTPNQAAIDTAVDNYLASGLLSAGPVAVDYPADQGGGGPGGMSSSDAGAVTEYVYRHRLLDSNDTLQALMARDSEVSQAYQTLLASGQLSTSADSDLTATLHHLSLLRNNGTTGGFSIGGNQVVSSGARPLPPGASCLQNPGGFITWPNGKVFDQCAANSYDEAIVTLTVQQPGGQIYRARTTSTSCGSNSAYGFRNVPNGAGQIIARPLWRCCEQASLNVLISCPPGPVILLSCLPVGTNRLFNLTMGPWTPPGYFGTTAKGAQVWIATKDDSCFNSGQTTANSSTGNFTVTGCLPAGDVYVYAQLGDLIGRVNVPDSPACGQGFGPNSITLQPQPTVSGNILKWQPSWDPNAGAMAKGCFMAGCNGGGTLTVSEPAEQATGSYHLQLKPGHWDLFSYHDLGTCTNSSGQTVGWLC